MNLKQCHCEEFRKVCVYMCVCQLLFLCMHMQSSLLDSISVLISSCGPLLTPAALSFSHPFSVTRLPLQLSPPISASIHYISPCSSWCRRSHTHMQARKHTHTVALPEIWQSGLRQNWILKRILETFYLHLFPHFHFILIPPHAVSPISVLFTLSYLSFFFSLSLSHTHSSVSTIFCLPRCRPLALLSFGPLSLCLCCSHSLQVRLFSLYLHLSSCTVS